MIYIYDYTDIPAVSPQIPIHLSEDSGDSYEVSGSLRDNFGGNF